MKLWIIAIPLAILLTSLIFYYFDSPYNVLVAIGLCAISAIVGSIVRRKSHTEDRNTNEIKNGD